MMKNHLHQSMMKRHQSMMKNLVHMTLWKVFSHLKVLQRIIFNIIINKNTKIKNIIIITVMTGKSMDFLYTNMISAMNMTRWTSMRRQVHIICCHAFKSKSFLEASMMKRHLTINTNNTMMTSMINNVQHLKMIA